ncbi:MAG: DUF4235 domain-containing protein [Marmoricola sp.]
MRKKKAKEFTPRAWKVMSKVTDKASGAAGNKLADASWRAATGKQPPAKPESPETSLRESIAWTVLSTAGVAVVKTLATRRAAAYFERSTGELPPALRTPTEPPAQ